MNFTPRSEHEIESDSLLADGEYDFEVAKAEEGTSKKGNPMIKVALKVFAPNGGTPFVYDYLLEAFLGKMLNFCSSTGLMAEYNSGSLEPYMLEGKCGKVKLAREAGSAQYKPKNVVVDYVKGDDSTVTQPSGRTRDAAPTGVSASQLEDDDIPFMRPHHLTVGCY